MTNIEQGGQPQADAQAKEPRLPKAELAERANQYLKAYRQALKRTPEFVQALPNVFFGYHTMVEDDYGAKQVNRHFETGIYFERGGQEYRVGYDSKNRRTSLYVDKDYRKFGALQGGADALKYEEVLLHEYYTAKRSGETPLSGEIRYGKYYNDGRIELHVDTPTAIQRVDDFLKINLNEPQDHAPTGK